MWTAESGMLLLFVGGCDAGPKDSHNTLSIRSMSVPIVQDFIEGNTHFSTTKAPRYDT